MWRNEEQPVGALRSLNTPWPTSRRSSGLRSTRQNQQIIRREIVLVIIHIVVMEIMASDTTAGSKLMRDK